MRLKAWFLAAALLAVAAPLAAQDDFHGCGMAGTAKPAAIKAVNRLKNRYTPPGDTDIDTAVTLKAMLKLGDDTDRFDEEKGAEIVGYVYDVKPGGKETCNCGATDSELRDTHIELVPSPTLNDKTHRVIVEITPRLRAKMAEQGEDWSTDALKAAIKHKWVRVRGWLLFDVEHLGNAEHTNPGGKKIWRATVWEIHPIAEFKVVAAPG
jgi:hypothetical protein